MRWTLRRELDTHSRIIAEQTARSLQAVDLVLRHIAGQRHTGARADLHIFLREQVIGLVQVEQLLLFDAQGKLMASSSAAESARPAARRVGRAAVSARCKHWPR